MHADKVVVLDIYPAREKPMNGVSGKMIVEAGRQSGHKDMIYLQDKFELPAFMKDVLKEGDRVVLFGAGDIFKFTPEIIKELNK